MTTGLSPDAAVPAAPPSRARSAPDGPFLLALLLAALAGWVDAAGVAGSGGMFVSFMSGDTTQGAISAAHLDWPRVAEIGAVIASFVAGVIAGERVDKPFGRFGPAAVLVLQAVFLGLGAWLPLRLPALTPARDGCLLAVAMGLQNATMHRAAGMNVGLTYITGTLVQFGRSVAGARRDGRDWGQAARFLGLWLSLAGGAYASAVVLPVSRSGTLAAAAALSVLLALVWVVLRMRPD